MPHSKEFDELKCEFECLKDDRLAVCGTASEDIGGGNFKGFDFLRKKKLNKGLAFTPEERQFLGIHGLLPAVVKTEQQQIEHCTLLFDRLRRKLDKFVYLRNLAERNERLFFKLIESNMERYLAMLRPPVLDDVCIKFSLIFQEPHGVYITAKDKCHVDEVLGNWPERDVRLIVVTDGERVLQLGDQGAHGMCIPITQTMLYTALGGFKPQHCLPVTLDCGSNNNALILDPLYIGLRRERLCKKFHAEIFEEFLTAVKRRYGQKCLVHCEGFGGENAIGQLTQHAEDHCMFNSDVQCIGSLVLAGIFTSQRLTGIPLREQVILLYGSGAASIGIAMLFNYAITRLGLKEKSVKHQVWLYSEEGLVAANQPTTDDSKMMASPFTVKPERVETLLEAIALVRPNILVGTAAVPRAFSKAVLKAMAQINERPIIFVLSSNSSKMECTAQEAFFHTAGTCLYASGVKFSPVWYQKLRSNVSQMQNSAICTGVALGVISAGMWNVPLEIFYIAAEALADLVTTDDLCSGLLYPSNSKVFYHSVEIAKWIMAFAYRFNLATVFPEPFDKIEFIKSHMYNLNYPNFIPDLYAIDC